MDASAARNVRPMPIFSALYLERQKVIMSHEHVASDFMQETKVCVLSHVPFVCFLFFP